MNSSLCRFIFKNICTKKKITKSPILVYRTEIDYQLSQFAFKEINLDFTPIKTGRNLNVKSMRIQHDH